MALSRSARDRQIDYWPGFVDALSTLLLVFTFLIAVFMLGQFFIGREMAGKEDVLQRLARQLSELSDLL
ncbi:MAG: peptidoglycan-binding protein, partial [Methylobacterium sp.]|nr:peptidoglycan-binding protein [Methylobacterium sp.]